MTYTVSSGTLNPSIPYHTSLMPLTISLLWRSLSKLRSDLSPAFLQTCHDSQWQAALPFQGPYRHPGAGVILVRQLQISLLTQSNNKANVLQSYRQTMNPRNSRRLWTCWYQLLKSYPVAVLSRSTELLSISACLLFHLMHTTRFSCLLWLASAWASMTIALLLLPQKKT